VNGRPRSVAFLSAGGIGFIPSESAGELNVIDTVNAKVMKTIALPRLPAESVSYRPTKNGCTSAMDVQERFPYSTCHSYELLDTIKRWGLVRGNSTVA